MNDPIAPPALYQEVAERLRRRIFAHELKPGDWIDETALAEHYGISRTPLREAIKVLAAEGLVTLKPRRGAFVTELAERDLDDIYAVMALLEGQCAAEVARHAGAAEIERLEAAHELLTDRYRDADIDAFFETNQAFHRMLHEIAGNRWLAQIVDDLRKVLKLNRHSSLQRAGRPAASLREHEAIMAALRARAAAGAEAAMRAHILAGRAALVPPVIRPMNSTTPQ
ncbi:MAG TPA: GntR family transcriptional regulator [Rhodocyclaceae bacterium]|nr:GntR family transcriptional regulator [Rhodocyclaceae bacterium]